jgi:flagellar motor switch protein FliG
MSRPETTGTQRAAAFLLSLDEQARSRVLGSMEAELALSVAAAMRDVDPELCGSAAIEELTGELARAAHTGEVVRSQDNDELLAILEASFGTERAQEMVREIEERHRRAQPFEFIEAYQPLQVVSVLANESPGVMALLMAHVAPSFSAAVLSRYEPQAAFEVVKRMTQIDPPHIDTLLQIADQLKARFEREASAVVLRDRSDSLRTIADLLTFSQTATEKAVLEGLEEHDDSVAKEIREFMFTWTDLADIDKRAMQKILAAVDTRTLSMALKACQPDVLSNIESNLSVRVKEMVADERELAGAVPFAEVQAARNEILTAVRTLMETGEFSPARAGQELVT